jgi:chlorinating enzyme
MEEKCYLTEAEVKFFYENGYVGPFTLYEPEEMTRIWEDVRLDLLDTSEAPFPDSKLNYDRHLDMLALNRMISHPRLVHRISSILGPDVLSWRTEWFPKYPGDEGTDWHQAESFVEFEGTEKLVPTAAEEGKPWELTAWIAMSEATRANGCLKVMPGSHRTWYFDEKRNIAFEPENFNKKLSDGQKSGFYGYDVFHVHVAVHARLQPELDQVLGALRLGHPLCPDSCAGIRGPGCVPSLWRGPAAPPLLDRVGCRRRPLSPQPRPNAAAAARRRGRIATRRDRHGNEFSLVHVLRGAEET